MSMYSQSLLPLAHASVASAATAAFTTVPEPGGLEDSLLQLVQDYYHNSLKLRERIEKAKKVTIKKAVRAMEMMVEAVNGGVQESFVKEKRIEHEIRALAVTITRFTKQTDQWLTVTNSVNTYCHQGNWGF